MNRTSIGLASLAGLLTMIMTVAGRVVRGGGRLPCARGAFEPLGGGVDHRCPNVAALGWRRGRSTVALTPDQTSQTGSLETLNAILAASAEDDPYSFVGTVFMSGMMMSTSKAGKERIVELAAVFKNMKQGS